MANFFVVQHILLIEVILLDLPVGVVQGSSSTNIRVVLFCPWHSHAGIQTSTDARFYHASATFDEFSNEDKTLVLQFTVKHEQNIDCGGGYIKVGLGLGSINR